MPEGLSLRQVRSDRSEGLSLDVAVAAMSGGQPLERKCDAGVHRGTRRLVTRFICVTCGTQFAATDRPPAACPICEDERQYVGWGGQQWTTLDGARRPATATGMPRRSRACSGSARAAFAIGQRALLVRPHGNVLWDCVPSSTTRRSRRSRSWAGSRAIAISHPHYYSAMVEWAHALRRARSTPRAPTASG